MKSNEKNILGKFYSKLKGKQKDGESVFLKILTSSRKTDVLQKINDCSLHRKEFDKDIKESLIEKDYIQSLDNNFGYYIITFKGLWEYEKSRNIINLEHLLNELNTTYFVSEKKSLSNKDMVLLLTFIGCRFYSEDCMLELKKDITSDENLNFSNLIKEVTQILLDNDLIKKKVDLKFLKQTNVSQYCLARVSELKKITHSIYRDDKRDDKTIKTYYLDICYQNNTIDVDRLKFLYNILFNGKFQNSDAILNIRKFLEQFARKRYLLTANKNFLSPDSTKILVKTFDDLYFS